MNRKKPFQLKTILTAVFMIITLLWFTISLHFITIAQQHRKQAAIAENIQWQNNSDSEDSNPFSSSSEEKAESGTGNISEYLHHSDDLFLLSGTLHKHHADHSASVYVAFHGELISPPPDSFL